MIIAVAVSAPCNLLDGVFVLDLLCEGDKGVIIGITNAANYFGAVLGGFIGSYSWDSILLLFTAVTIFSSFFCIIWRAIDNQVISR